MYRLNCNLRVYGLISAEDADVRFRLLNRIERELNITLSDITIDCHRIENLKKDMILVPNGPQINQNLNSLQFIIASKSFKREN